MLTGYQISTGQDIGDRLAPWVPGMAQYSQFGYQRADGGDIAPLFAPLQYGTQGGFTGFQINDARDISLLIAQIGSTVQTPGFNGGSYSRSVSGVVGGGPQYVEAFMQLIIDGNGTWRATGGTTWESQTTDGSGSLYFGGPSGWEYRLFTNNGQDTGWVSATTTGSVGAQSRVRNIGSEFEDSEVIVYYQARRAGTGDVVINASCRLITSAAGNQQV